MTKKLGLVTGVVAVIAVLAILGFTQMIKPQTANQQQALQETSKPADSSSKGTIKSLLASGKNVSCDITMPEGSGQGKVYVSGTKVRGDFVTKIDGKDLNTHMITDESNVYVWTDGSSQGTKFKIDAKTATQSDQTQAADLDQEVDLKCSNWGVDTSKFNVPTNVQFTDLSQVMNLPSSSGNSAAPKLDSSLCNQITDPAAKAACIKALGN